eukprot:8896676-Ditylum_brightwellii.AAC.1
MDVSLASLPGLRRLNHVSASVYRLGDGEVAPTQGYAKNVHLIKKGPSDQKKVHLIKKGPSDPKAHRQTVRSSNIPGMTSGLTSHCVLLRHLTIKTEKCKN